MKKESPNEISDTSATGSHDYKDTKYIVFPFGRYKIIVETTLDDKFIGIVEVKINTDFRSHSQRIASTKIHDVEEYYKDE